MAFFFVTNADGRKSLVSSETITFCEPYDREEMRSELSNDEKRRRASSEVEDDLEPSGGLQQAFASIDALNAKIHFTDGTWRGVRETPDAILQLGNAALSQIQQPEQIQSAAKAGLF